MKINLWLWPITMLFILAGGVWYYRPNFVQTGTVLAQEPVRGTNLLSNSDFATTLDGWWNATNQESSAEGVSFNWSGGEACVSMVDGGQSPWDVQVGQNGVALQVGKRYEVRFDTQSSENRPITLKLIGSAPWVTYTYYTTPIIDKTNTYYHLFLQSATDSNVTVAFHIGGAGSGQICFDNISLHEIESATLPRAVAASLPAGISTTSNYGRVQPLLWPNGAKAALSLTFDDGSYTHSVHARPILNQHNLPSTFYVTDGLTLGSNRAGTWEQFQQLSAEGHEVAAHSWTHTDLTTLPIGDINTPYSVYHEFAVTNLDIETHIPDKKVISMAYPFIQYNEGVSQLASQFYLSARTADDQANSAYDNEIKWYAISSYAAFYGQPRASTADDAEELLYMQEYVQNKVIDKGGWGTILFHEVIPFEELATNTTWHPTTNDFLQNFTDWLQSKKQIGELWVDTVGNVTRYVKSRDHLKSYLVSESADQLEIAVTDQLDDSIFDYPIWVEISVPSHWKSAEVVQGETKMTIPTYQKGSDSVVRTQLRPIDSVITLRNYSAPTAIILNQVSSWAWPLGGLAAIIVGFGTFSLATFGRKRKNQLQSSTKTRKI